MQKIWKMMNNAYVKGFVKFLMMTFGAFIVSVGLELFLIPNDIIDGGVVGISIMSSHLSGIPLGVFTFLLNIPFLVIGYRQIGKSFAVFTLYSVTMLSIFVTLLHPVPAITDDTLLSTVFGGMILGAGVGLIIRNGGSLDGTEVVAIILDKRTTFSVGEIVMIFNIFIMGAAGFIFGWETSMYSLLAYFIAFKVIDIVIEGLDETKAVTIISDYHDDIASAIRDRLGRGVTYLEGRCCNGEKETTLIYVVVSRLEIAKIKLIVNGFDDYALMTISNVEVEGKRYKKRPIH
jgi:uncharacterized membrane-anchored protein YitT (DUF2179 family)